MAKVYNYLTHSLDTDEMRSAPAKAVVEWIQRVAGKIIQDSEEDVDAAALDAKGRLWRPAPEEGVQSTPGRR